MRELHSQELTVVSAGFEPVFIGSFIAGMHNSNYQNTIRRSALFYGVIFGVPPLVLGSAILGAMGCILGCALGSLDGIIGYHVGYHVNQFFSQDEGGNASVTNG
jgi:hypothetical protein